VDHIKISWSSILSTLKLPGTSFSRDDASLVVETQEKK
jgi:hypothetical protein